MARAMHMEANATESESPASAGLLADADADGERDVGPSYFMPARRISGVAASCHGAMSAVVGTGGGQGCRLGTRLLLIAALVAACLLAVTLGGRRGASGLRSAMGSDATVQFDAIKLCPDLHVWTAACMELGKPDGDCCAMPGDGECKAGQGNVEGDDYVLFVGAQCAENGAVATCCTKTPQTMEQKSANDAEEKANPAVLVVDNYCAGPHTWGACVEHGKEDADCCAAPKAGGCAYGFVFTEGEQCHPSGAKRTCCTKLHHGLCPSDHVWSACLENGDPDVDCCGGNETSCSKGFHFSKGEQCHNNGAVATCCTKKSKLGYDAGSQGSQGHDPAQR